MRCVRLASISKFYTDPIMLDFALGMLIGLFHRHAAESPKWMAGLVLSSAGVAVLLPLLLPTVPSIETSGLPAVLIVGGAVLLENADWKVRSPLLLLLGDASYSIYLVHPFVTQVFREDHCSDTAERIRERAFDCSNTGGRLRRRRGVPPRCRAAARPQASSHVEHAKEIRVTRALYPEYRYCGKETAGLWPDQGWRQGILLAFRWTNAVRILWSRSGISS